ncbi:hypothetical protein DQ04_00941110 [Trypanosoma grayi]|uniref:hypothetical protein n=1 Tax=Trypanosoma grayi TaxID=71804 RepID=UPI0004F477D3|nr:hypothetical protein DQ04_00941110 [Trypanosoma grayi]KEG13547.1 hypothetical protein DQ04_00941110 [Trypanosoma grayi]
MRRPDTVWRRSKHGERNSMYDSDILPPSEGDHSCEREEGLQRLQQALATATEFVFQQRLAIERQSREQPLADRVVGTAQVHEGSDDAGAAQRQLADLEDNLAQQANQYIRAANVTALSFLNEKQYTRALQLLLGVEEMVQRGGGKWFPFFVTTESVVQDTKGFAQSLERPRSGEDGCVKEIFVPYFIKRHERMQQLALAVVENNIGLYHFKIGEYELAARRMSRALQLEESLGVETIGVTYFNMAQTQYELGCVEEAFSAIALAEEAIEKRIYNFCVQKRHLRRMAEHGDEPLPAYIPGLEKRILGGHLGWREEVCLLSRVLEKHGSWLQNNSAYKAAMNRYEQSERWFSSVKPHSIDEKSWLQELQKSMQVCRRAQRHTCCAPRVPLTPAPASAPPKSTIVTTALPRRFEVVVDATQQVVEQHQQERRTPSRYRDVNGFSSATCYRKHDDILKPYTSDSAARSRRRRSESRRPQWDDRTTVIRSDERRSRSITTATGSAVFTNSEAATSPCVTSAANTPLSRRVQQKPVLSATSLSHSNVGCAMSKPGVACSPTAVQRQGTPHHRPVADLRGRVKRAVRKNVGTASSTPGGGMRILSFMQCIHTLQAFAQARLSALESEHRVWELGRLGSAPPSISSSQLSSSMRNGWLHHANHTMRFLPSSSRSLGSSRVSVEAVPCNGSASRHPNEVLLGFLAAHRSVSLVHRIRLEKRFAMLMEGVQKQSQDPTETLQTIVSAKPQAQAWANINPLHLNDSYTLSGAKKKGSHDRNDRAPHESYAVKKNASLLETTSDDAGLSEGQYQRRYNSLLRMNALGAVENVFPGSTNATKGNVGRKAVPAITYVTGPEFHSLLTPTPCMTGHPLDHNVATDKAAAVASSARLELLWANTSGTRQPTTYSHNEVGGSGGSARVLFQGNKPDVEGTYRNGFKVSNRSEVCDVVDGDSSPHRNALQGTLPFASDSSDFIPHITRELIQQRILREEAAIIIQLAWRRWRTRRQSVAVCKLRYR